MLWGLSNASLHFVVPISSYLVLLNTLQRLSGELGIVLHRNLRRHTPHRMRTAAVASVNEQLHVRLHERGFHGQVLAVGGDFVFVSTHLLDVGENVVPGIEAGGGEEGSLFVGEVELLVLANALANYSWSAASIPNSGW